MHSNNKIKEVCPVDKCTGCSACYNACRHQAINMVEDSMGHLHPEIDSDKCVGCHLCQMSCPVINRQTLLYPKSCYALALAEEKDLMESASGGAATALMRAVVSEDGIVYGCTGEDVFHVHHIRVDSLQDIQRLRGSKYVQSEIGTTYSDVLKDLKDDKIVLFTGTPCQIAGLKSFLRKDYSNLTTIDLVCHGVPSQKMLTENIGYYTEEKDGKKIKVLFRKKVVNEGGKNKHNSARIVYGWFLQNQPYTSINRKFYDDSYMFGFLQCLTFRESCYTCRYATSARCSDITVADFWGLGDEVDFEKGKGVSLCFVNTNKGQVLLDKIKKQVVLTERDIVEGISGNGQLQRPSGKNKSHRLFRNLYPNVGLKVAIDQSLKMEKFKLTVLLPLKKFIKNTIGRN